MQIQINWLIFIAPLGFLLFVGGLIPFMRYTGLGRDKSYLLYAVSLIAGGVQSFQRARELEPFMRDNFGIAHHNLEIGLRIAAAGLVFPLLAAFALRLWGRWIGGKATAEERASGAAGIHAWFSTANVTVGLLLIVCAWYGYDISPLLTAVLAGVALAAYPVLNMESPAFAAAAGHPGIASVPKPPEDDLSAEREKILSMLEAGKLTPEESAELLQALGESARTPAHPVPLTGHQRLMLIGAALVALGFFLPWFVINPGKEMNRLMEQTQSQFTFTSPQGSNSSFPQELLPRISGPVLNTPTTNISGGEIQRGFGWATLLLAVAAALIPYVGTNLDTATTRTVRLLCLGLGAFIVVYLLSQNVRFIGVGLIVVLAGYALEIAGALRERQAAGA